MALAPLPVGSSPTPHHRLSGPEKAALHPCESKRSFWKRYVRAANDCKQRGPVPPALPQRSDVSAAVRCADAEPAIAGLMVMRRGVVSRGVKLQRHRRQPSNRIEHRVGGQDADMLPGTQRDARLFLFLLCFL